MHGTAWHGIFDSGSAKSAKKKGRTVRLRLEKLFIFAFCHLGQKAKAIYCARKGNG